MSKYTDLCTDQSNNMQAKLDHAADILPFVPFMTAVSTCTCIVHDRWWLSWILLNL